MFEYRAMIDRVIDGDTVVAIIDCGFRIYHEMTLRLYGIDAPELATLEGGEAKQYLAKLLNETEDGVRIKTVQDVHAHDKPDSFGRYLATLYGFETGKDLNAAMVEAGHAKVWKPKS